MLDCKINIKSLIEIKSIFVTTNFKYILSILEIALVNHSSEPSPPTLLIIIFILVALLLILLIIMGVYWMKKATLRRNLMTAQMSDLVNATVEFVNLFINVYGYEILVCTCPLLLPLRLVA